MDNFIEFAIVTCGADCHEDHLSECLICGKKHCYKVEPCACEAPHLLGEQSHRDNQKRKAVA